MALTVTKKVTLAGSSIIEGIVAENYQAEINSDDPNDMTIQKWQGDKEKYKEHRTDCRKDAADFEDRAYTLQDEMIAAKND